MSKRVYLAGPITGLGFDDAHDWRQQVVEDLAEVGIEAFSPMRHKEALKGLPTISGTTEEYEHLGPFARQKGILTRDRYDCTHADMIIMNLLGAQRVSIGTCVELGWADAFRVPVVMVIEPAGNVHEHCFTRELCGFRVERLEEAVAVVKAVLIQPTAGRVSL